MSNPDAYVREINSLNAEIKRLNAHLKQLREQRKVVQNHLYSHMTKHHLDKYEGHTIKSVTPRQTKPRKPESAKKADAIELFRQAGISDPENFFDEFKATQKYGEDEEPPPKEEKPKRTRKGKKSDKDYDPFLGF